MMTFIFYLIVDFVSIFFFALYIKNRNERFSFIYLTLSFMTLFLTVALRSSNVGTDYISVADAYTRISNGSELANDIHWFGYPLYIISLFLGKILHCNYVVFYAVIAFFTLFFVYKSIIDYSDNKMLSLLLFISFCLFYQLMNQSRQLLAISIVLYSFKYIEKNDWKKYFIFVLIASCIHNSALIMLPFYFLNKLKLNWKLIIFVILITSFLTFCTPFFEILISISSYKIYLNTIYNISFKLSTILNMIFRLILFLCSFLILNKYNCKKNQVLLNLAFLCTLIQVIVVKYYFIGRLSTYFFVSYIYLIPKVYEHIKNFKIFGKKVIPILLIVFLIIIHCFYYFSCSGAVGSGYNIYHSILERNR